MVIANRPVLARMSIETINIRVKAMNGWRSHRQCMLLSDDLTVVYPTYLIIMAITRQARSPITTRIVFLRADCNILNMQSRMLIDTTRIWILHYPKVAIIGIHGHTRMQVPTKTGMAAQMFH
jgi:hypothetical protein